MKKQPKKISTEEFDQKFDAGEDIEEYLVPGTRRVIKPKTKRILVDLPDWMLDFVTEEATRKSIARNAVIKYILGDAIERIERERKRSGGEPENGKAA